jgi:hypothetical protein
MWFERRFHSYETVGFSDRPSRIVATGIDLRQAGAITIVTSRNRENDIRQLSPCTVLEVGMRGFLTSFCAVMFGCILLLPGFSQAQTIREYTAKRAPGPIVLDGRLTDPGWSDAPLTEKFVIYTNGAATVFPTQCKMLWDDTYLYIAFIMDDRDVWGTTTVWSDPDYCLCAEEVAEMFVDPDGDGLNYLEVEINPLGAVMDLSMDKEFSKGGSGNWDWSYQNLKIGISVQGTLNNKADSDTSWVCELAFPFSEIAWTAPTMSFPPTPGDAWRLNVYRYDYGRTSAKYTELSAWNQTDVRGFHAPDKFGRVIFSSEVSGAPTAVAQRDETPRALSVIRNYPNPFNPSTTIEFTIPSSGTAKLEMFNAVGQKCLTLFSGNVKTGTYRMTWNGRNANGEISPSGIYFARLSMGSSVSVRRMLLLK